MKSDFRVESFKRKFSTIFFLMTECPKRNRKNYQRNKKSHARIKLDHGLALVGLRTTGPMPKICFVSEWTKKVNEENGMKISFHKFLERETHYRYYTHLALWPYVFVMNRWAFLRLAWRSDKFPVRVKRVVWNPLIALSSKKVKQ